MIQDVLSKNQRALIGKKRTDMSDEQLLNWIHACNTIETHPNISHKARGTWKRSRVEAQAELEKRAKRRTMRTAKK